MSMVPLHDLAVLAAATGEKSKAPFYIAGGVLAGWAVLVSFLGVRQPEFPGRLGGQRIVMAISAVLVLAATTAAVASSGAPPKEHAASTRAAPGARGPAPASAAAPASASTSAPPAGGGATRLQVAADPQGQLAFDSKTLKASAGAVRVSFANKASLPHNFTIRQGSSTVAATPTITGSSATLSTTLKPGTYTFLCTVPGHAEAGMTGTLTVS